MISDLSIVCVRVVGRALCTIPFGTCWAALKFNTCPKKALIATGKVHKRLQSHLPKGGSIRNKRGNADARATRAQGANLLDSYRTSVSQKEFVPLVSELAVPCCSYEYKRIFCLVRRPLKQPKNSVL